MNAFKKATAFMGDYGDKRARATFQTQVPVPQLNLQPAPRFASRWADPNHPVNQGGVHGVLSSAVVDPKVRRRQRRQNRRVAMGRSTNANGQQRTGMVGGLKLKLHEVSISFSASSMPYLPKRETLLSIPEVRLDQFNEDEG